jgi:hypothetical protein
VARFIELQPSLAKRVLHKRVQSFLLANASVVTDENKSLAAAPVRVRAYVCSVLLCADRQTETCDRAEHIGARTSSVTYRIAVVRRAGIAARSQEQFECARAAAAAARAAARAERARHAGAQSERRARVVERLVGQHGRRRHAAGRQSARRATGGYVCVCARARSHFSLPMQHADLENKLKEQLSVNAELRSKVAGMSQMLSSDC